MNNPGKLTQKYTRYTLKIQVSKVKERNLRLK